MGKFLLHSLFLFVAVFLAFFWTSSPTLSLYTLQLIGLFVFLFFLNQFLRRQPKTKTKINQRALLAVDGIILTLVIMLLVYSTGGLTSPLFFLVYFLMFGLALLFEPLITLSLAGVMVLLFLLTPTKQEPLNEFLQLFSLLLITPLALFFGNQYLKLLESEEKIKILKEENQITEEQIAKTETNTLLWTTLNFKEALTVILDEISNLLADVSHLTVRQKESLEKIRRKALELLKSGEKLKEEVDKTTDE
ncbi:MAG: hypothetical protein ACPLKP_03310 [Microgenomates group bacterium]